MRKRRHRRELSKLEPAPAGAPLASIGHNVPLSYAQRNELIRVELGFESYQEYLESDLWASIRARAMKRYGKGRRGKRRRCWVCLSPWVATQVHHVVYTRNNLKGFTVTNLKPVCDLCHGTAEFLGSKKLSAEETRQRTIQLANDPTWPPRARKIRRALARDDCMPPKIGSQSKAFEERRRQLAAAVKRNRRRARR